MLIIDRCLHINFIMYYYATYLCIIPIYTGLKNSFTTSNLCLNTWYNNIKIFSLFDKLGWGSKTTGFQRDYYKAQYIHIRSKHFPPTNAVASRVPCECK